jgi:hypothetical protein
VILRMLASWPLMTALLVLDGFPLEAQTAEAALSPEATKQSVVRLRTEGTRVTGRLLALGRGTANLETSAGTRQVNLGAVDSVWVRHRAIGTGALLGGIVGGISGALFLGAVVAAACESDCDNAWLEGGLAGLGLGTAGGALVGAAIGAAIPKWRLRFPLGH